jgi:hypothetical protein
MTTKSDFSEEEWKLVLEAPTGAGMMVVTAARGGSFRETFAMTKSYTEARKQHGQSQLLDEIVSAKPGRDRTRYRSAEELKQGALGHIRDAVALLQSKATPEELEDYSQFILNLAHNVAEAHEEGGERTSAGEQAAIDEIAGALGRA